MFPIPNTILKKLYDRSSLCNTVDGVSFSLRNRLSPASIEQVIKLSIDGEDVDLDRTLLIGQKGQRITLSSLGGGEPTEFEKDAFWQIQIDREPLAEGSHQIDLVLVTKPFGKIHLSVRDELLGSDSNHIPRDHRDDYNPDIIRQRQAFIESRSGAKLEHVAGFTFDPQTTRGNMEHFTGVAQVPLGFAGPLLVRGQHAKGEFFIPLAATEGTLVASYNRGMKLLNRCGGVKCTVVGDNMQRAPVLAFEDAEKARRFADWLGQQEEQLRSVAEATDPFIRLKYVDYYLSNKFCYLRFNYTTGDAAGQNMVGKATFAASNWILENYKADKVEKFYLEANLATDKKASQMNIMRTRGKRVTAEALIKRHLLQEIMGADTESLYEHGQIANIGSMLSGANNNGLHSANAIAAIFLATGQDVADVSESSVALLYTELTAEKDLYISITLPSLIVATCGGGTGLATQRECLQVMGCSGVGKVRKFAEIVAGTVLAGELSLASAISSLDWVSSHEEMGRNPT